MSGVTGITYVRYQAPDLDRMESFLTDFGLKRAFRTATALYMRGTGSDHHIHVTELGDESRGLGVGLRVGAREDLERIAAQMGAKVEKSPEPGGGLRTVLTDPSGFRVDLLYGQDKAAELPVREPLVLNNSKEVKRLGVCQRPIKGPSHVVRMEHSVLNVQNFEAACEFYCDVLGMKVSDKLYKDDPKSTVVAFLHCGMGSSFTDHHTIALAALGPSVSIHHSAFVTLDWDDLMLGHYHLKERGHSHDWGIGRHILGSEVFDYWYDPFGNMVEHCMDGDMVNDQHQPSELALDDEVLAIWSPPPSPHMSNESSSTS